jgi:nicotinate-nucleotide pyrophosphorylase (carboxylating)
VVAQIVRLCAGRVPVEATGGITLDNVAEYAQTGVDRISVGALTHSAPAVDLTLEWTDPSAR